MSDEKYIGWPNGNMLREKDAEIESLRAEIARLRADLKALKTEFRQSQNWPR